MSVALLIKHLWYITHRKVYVDIKLKDQYATNII